MKPGIQIHHRIYLATLVIVVLFLLGLDAYSRDKICSIRIDLRIASVSLVVSGGCLTLDYHRFAKGFDLRFESYPASNMAVTGRFFPWFESIGWGTRPVPVFPFRFLNTLVFIGIVALTARALKRRELLSRKQESSRHPSP